MATSPVIMASYAHSGARQVQELLADGTGLACTVGTGIIPQCAHTAQAWQRVENREGTRISRLAVSSVRTLVNAQVTAILASAGQARWCELTIASQHPLDSFLQIFPSAAVVCVHRRCPDVISAMVHDSPWGLSTPTLKPYLLSYPGNNVAAIAAWWASQTAELLAFESEHPASSHRIRLEDVTADPATMTSLRVWLELGHTPSPAALPPSPALPQPEPPPPFTGFPADMLPPALHQHINKLHAELGYPAVG